MAIPAECKYVGDNYYIGAGVLRNILRAGIPDKIRGGAGVARINHRAISVIPEPGAGFGNTPGVSGDSARVNVRLCSRDTDPDPEEISHQTFFTFKNKRHVKVSL